MLMYLVTLTTVFSPHLIPKNKDIRIYEWFKYIIFIREMFFFSDCSEFHIHSIDTHREVLSWGQSSDANLKAFDENIEDMNTYKSNHERVDKPHEEVLGNHNRGGVSNGGHTGDGDFEHALREVE